MRCKSRRRQSKQTFLFNMISGFGIVSFFLCMYEYSLILFYNLSWYLLYKFIPFDLKKGKSTHHPLPIYPNPIHQRPPSHPVPTTLRARKPHLSHHFLHIPFLSARPPFRFQPPTNRFPHYPPHFLFPLLHRIHPHIEQFPIEGLAADDEDFSGRREGEDGLGDILCEGDVARHGIGVSA